MRYIYRPVVPPKKRVSLAVSQLVTTFFQGSPTRLIQAALLDGFSTAKISDEELDELERIIRDAKGEEKMTRAGALAKSVAILSLGAVIAAAMRRQSAACRYVVWLISLSAILLAPAGVLLPVPRWSSP